jgi:hypothetical protein
MIFLLFAPPSANAVSIAVKTLFKIHDMVTAISEKVIGENMIDGLPCSYPEFPDYLGEYSDKSIFIGLNGLRIRNDIASIPLRVQKESKHFGADLLFENRKSLMNLKKYSLSIESLKYALSYSEFKVRYSENDYWPDTSYLIRTSQLKPSQTETDVIFHEFDILDLIENLDIGISYKRLVTHNHSTIPIRYKHFDSIKYRDTSCDKLYKKYNQDPRQSEITNIRILELAKLSKNIELDCFVISNTSDSYDNVQEKVTSIDSLYGIGLSNDSITIWNKFVATTNPKNISIYRYPESPLVWINIESLCLAQMDIIEANQILKSINDYGKSVKQLTLHNIGVSNDVVLEPGNLENLKAIDLDLCRGIDISNILEIPSLKGIVSNDSDVFLDSRRVWRVNAKLEYLRGLKGSYYLELSNVEEVTVHCSLSSPQQGTLIFSDDIKSLRLQLNGIHPRNITVPPHISWPRNLQKLELWWEEQMYLVYRDDILSLEHLQEIKFVLDVPEVTNITGFERITNSLFKRIV